MGNGKRTGSLLSVLKSVIAGAFGVQSQSQYHKDFSRQSALPFVIVGVVFVLSFVATLAWLVSVIV